MSEARDSRFIADNQQQVERLSKLGWYHSIELPDGSVIPGHQSVEQLRTRLRQFHIPEDLTGKRVLDIGAWDGWFSFEMERRGATVLALDSAKNTRLLEAKALLGSRIDYRIGDICRLTSRDLGTFDIVLFLGVLYHLKHPLLALENVCGMCSDMACIESFVTDGARSAPQSDATRSAPQSDATRSAPQSDATRSVPQSDATRSVPQSDATRSVPQSDATRSVPQQDAARAGDPDALPSLEFYETTELRGQLDNWCGPNIACLLAFARTAGFARVQFESVLAERAHVSAWRKWNQPEGEGPAPRILCLENSTTHDHNFSVAADDYVTFYFTCESSALSCDNVFPEVGGFGSRPFYVANTGGGWQASCKLPPGLTADWHTAKLRVEGCQYSAPLRIGVDMPLDDRKSWRATTRSPLEITRLADGKTFESRRVRVGDGGALSVWVTGLPASASVTDLCVRLNGTDLPAVWLAPDAPSRQINVLLPSGLEPDTAFVSVVFADSETQPLEVEFYR